MEELKSCTHLLLPFGAGCTAPPPTPIRRAEPCALVGTISSDDDTVWSRATPGLRPLFHKHGDFVDVDVDVDVDDDGDGDGVGIKGSSSGIMCQDSTPPSRADLDELAHFLMQQSLLSTPTLLASPSLRRRKQGISPGSDVGEASDKSNGNKQQTECLVVGGRPSTYNFSMEGFCEESKTGIRRACEEEGAFYVQVADIGKPSLAQVDYFFEQCRSTNGMCLIGSCPLLPISELMTSTQSQEASTISSCQEEDGAFHLSIDCPVLLQNTQTVESVTDANFREAMRMLANMLVEISKELLKLLLEDICDETKIELRSHFFKPLLYIHKCGGQEPYVSRRNEDAVLSILSHDKANNQAHNEKESFLAILGSHIQTWSKGKLKAPTSLSLDNRVDDGICIQFDLVYHL